MPDREKLIELIHSARFDIERICNERFDCDGCPADIHEGECKAGYIADHLIANSVTIQQWIPVTERLPEEGVWVLCWYEYFRFGDYNRMFQTYGIGYYFRDGMWGGEVSNGQQAKVLAWMPLPKAPADDK